MSNMQYFKHSRNKITLIVDIGKEFLKVSEFDFTLLRTSDLFWLEKSTSSWNFLTTWITFAAYMFSSISDRAKLK